MAIRMKEWGMLAAPGQSVRVPTQGVTGWLEAARSLGSGLSSVLQGGAALHALQQVERTGELAAFTERLRGISSELREELQEQGVTDWDYAWQRAATPLLAEAVEELSPESRAPGRELARAYSAQASIEARRDCELERVEAARGQWQQRVEEAVEAGLGEQAARWLEAGRAVFVPEEELEERQQDVQSRACLRRWEGRLQASPLETLAALTEGGELAPLRVEERRQLEQAAAAARREQRSALAQLFSQELLEGREPGAPERELAFRAGLLPEASGGGGRPQEPAALLSPAARSSWRRWLDERAEGEEADAATRLRLALAPLPLEERRSLLQYLERGAQIPAPDRRALSRGLFELYHSGAFGCPGDSLALGSLLELQEEGAALLAEQGATGAADWLVALRDKAGHWICFDEESHKV